MRLSAHDASFLYTETASGPMHGVGIHVLDGEVAYEDILRFYAERIHLVPRLRQKLAFVPFNLAHPKWVDDPDFDLAYHVRKERVPRGTSFKKVRELALKLGEPLLDRDRPLWLFYVVEGMDDKTVIVQITHHAFVDGATAIAITHALSERDPEPPPARDVPEWRPGPSPTEFDLWQEAVTENATGAIKDAQNALQSARDAASIATRSASLMQRMDRPVMQAPWNASLVGPKRSMASHTAPLHRLLALKAAAGCTLNDIGVAAVSEAAARYMESFGESTSDQYLRLMCPVNVRSPDEDPLSGSGNRVSAMFPVLPAWSMPAAERLARVKAEFDEIKQQGEPEVLDQLQTLQPSLPPIAMAQTLAVGTQWDPTQAAARAPLPIFPTPPGGSRPVHVGFNFTCTNVPGPPWTQYVAGHRVENMFGTLMLGGTLGLGVSMNSYDGQLNFNFTADPRLVPKVKRLAKLTAAVLEELEASAGLGTNSASSDQAPVDSPASPKTRQNTPQAPSQSADHGKEDTHG